MSNVLVNGGTALEWSVENPILPDGVIGTESDTTKFKTGDGITTWNALGYGNEINSSYLWGEQTAEQAGEGLHYFSDVGENGSLWYNNGTYFIGHNILHIAQKLPAYLPSSGSFADNGALTLTTAIPSDVIKAWMYFKASAIYSGSAAGMYYVEMSSTTAGIAYNNVYTEGDAAEPTTKVPFVCTGPGAYTQTNGVDVVMLKYPVPAGVLGRNGSIIVEHWERNNNSAGNKYTRVKHGSTTYTDTVISTSRSTSNYKTKICNMNNEAVQIGNPSGLNLGLGQSTSDSVIGANNTAGLTYIYIAVQLQTATDWVGISKSFLELSRLS
jgi:hypothetical protein